MTIKSVKTLLFNNIDALDLYFYEGENELEFDINDYSFVVTYSLEYDDIITDEGEDIKGESNFNIVSIHVYDNNMNEDMEIDADDEIQKLFLDYYKNEKLDDEFKPINVNFGEFSDIFDE